MSIVWRGAMCEKSFAENTHPRPFLRTIRIILSSFEIFMGPIVHSVRKTSSFF